MSQTPPPPPPGGYGPPPPTPPGAYGAPPSGAGGYNAGDAAGYGWSKFQANAGQIVLAGLIVFVGIVVLEIIGIVIRSILVTSPSCSYNSDGVFRCTDGSGFFVSLLASGIMSLLFFIAFQVIGAGIVRGALDVTAGRPFVVGTIFKFDNLGAVVITSLISSVIIFVGTLLCFLPGLIAAFFLSYALYFVIDKQQAPVEALTSSFNLVKDNLSATVVWYLLSLVIIVVGAILCGVGLIVAIPVSILGTAYTYRKLTGQPVAP